MSKSPTGQVAYNHCLHPFQLYHETVLQVMTALTCEPEMARN